MISSQSLLSFIQKTLLLNYGRNATKQNYLCYECMMTQDEISIFLREIWSTNVCVLVYFKKKWSESFRLYHKSWMHKDTEKKLCDYRGFNLVAEWFVVRKFEAGCWIFSKKWDIWRSYSGLDWDIWWMLKVSDLSSMVLLWYM